jgi:hypothetical protein
MLEMLMPVAAIGIIIVAIWREATAPKRRQERIRLNFEQRRREFIRQCVQRDRIPIDDALALCRDMEPFFMSEAEHYA